MLTLKQKRILSERVPYLSASAALALVVVCHLFAHRPAARELAGLREQTAAARAELATARVRLADLPRVEQDVTELRQRLASARRLPQGQSLDEFVRQITAFGEESSLSKLTVQQGVPRARDLLSELPVSLSFEGDFLGACGFLRRTEQLERVTSVKAVTIKTVDPTQGRVEVQLLMNLYFANAD